MELCLYLVGALVIGVVCVCTGIAFIREGGTYWSDTQGRRRSNALAGAATLFIGVVALAGGYPMSRDVEPRLFLVAAAILGTLCSLWALVGAISLTAAPTLVAQVRTLLEEGHAPGDIEIPGRSLIGDMIRAWLAGATPPVAPLGYRAAPIPDDGGVVAAEARRRRGLVKAVVLGSPALAPLVALAYFVFDDAPLERLGWQALAVTTLMAALCGWLGWRLRAQVALVRRELTTLGDVVR